MQPRTRVPAALVLLALAAPCSAFSVIPREPQVLRFRDAATGANVVLVGTMHYNPVSIETTVSTILNEKQKGKLSAVVIERYARSRRRARCAAAAAAGRPV